MYYEKSIASLNINYKTIKFPYQWRAHEANTIAAPSLTSAPAPFPQIYVHVSLVDVFPPDQVHPDSIAHERFSMKTSWIFQ